MNQAKAEWRDEPVPHWDRAAHLVPRPSKLPWWSVWFPTVACACMMLWVMLGVRLSTDDGLNLKVAAFETATEDRAEEEKLEERLVLLTNSLLEEANTQQREQLVGLLARFQENQTRRTSQMIADLQLVLQEEREDALQAMMAQWAEQRDQDILWMKARVDDLYLRQEDNVDNMYKIVRYVNAERK